ncbi:SagB family peptide dehydrogenase [Streptomyces varsoviensis]|uniref:SagB/ThcOx family dehydrogenase n=1 Tax=Streptomyces varsoviensis TaxID=67373 RepID=UPI0033F7F936
MGTAHDYLSAVMRRSRVGMPPIGYVPNWADKPRLGKYYPDAQTFPLPQGDDPEAATFDLGLLPPPADPAPFDLTALGGMLRDSYGLLSRRLAIHANDDLASLPFYAGANWARGTASGGGLYPVSVYWANGPSGPLTPGVHYYDTSHHALRRLLTGDVTPDVRAALDLPELPEDTDQFLVLGIKFWQNAFKYNSFSYHATTMDVGTITQSWRMWARARGLSVEPAFWFDEERLNALLGADAADEGFFAVIPLRWDAAAGGGMASGAAAGGAPGRPAKASAEGPRVRHAEQEKSREPRTFETLEAMHAATRLGAADRPDRTALAAARARPPRAGDAIALPEPAPLDATVRGALRARRSSFGRFAAEQPLTEDQLSAVLYAAVAGGALPCDVAPAGGEGPSLVKMYAFVNHVEGIAPGVYEYAPDGNTLRPVADGPQGTFLQQNYFLSNYNVEQAGVVLVPTLRAAAVLDAVGDRGYRLVNAVVGAVAQATYSACGALGLGCGAALGFDNISYIDRMGLDGTDEVPLLITLIGNERSDGADFRYEIA